VCKGKVNSFAFSWYSTAEYTSIQNKQLQCSTVDFLYSSMADINIVRACAVRHQRGVLGHVP
jgi:hypothetical protein